MQSKFTPGQLVRVIDNGKISKHSYRVVKSYSWENGNERRRLYELDRSQDHTLAKFYYSWQLIPKLSISNGRPSKKAQRKLSRRIKLALWKLQNKSKSDKQNGVYNAKRAGVDGVNSLILTCQEKRQK